MLRPAAYTALALTLAAGHPGFAQDVDLSVVHRIKEEAFTRSRVMDYVFELTDRNGSRLTGSPGYHRATEAVVAAMRAAGMTDAAAEPWEGFGRGWSYDRVSIQMRSPETTTLAGIPMAWSEGTAGPVLGDVISAPLIEEDSGLNRFDLEQYAERIAAYRDQYAGQLRGKIVLIEAAHEFRPAEEAPFQRLGGDDLQEIAGAQVPEPKAPWTWPVWQLPSDGEERGAEYRRMPPAVHILARRGRRRRARRRCPCGRRHDLRGPLRLMAARRARRRADGEPESRALQPHRPAARK
jgi:hypothetical protein